MHYKIVHANCIEDLENQVNAMLARGWLPIGGVAVLPKLIQMSAPGETFMQSMYFKQKAAS